MVESIGISILEYNTKIDKSMTVVVLQHSLNFKLKFTIAEKLNSHMIKIEFYHIMYTIR